MNKIIESRRSIRKYRADKPVGKAQLKQLIAAAMMAPSACNSRPWEFIAVTKKEVIAEIARVHPYAKMVEQAGALIVVVALPQNGIADGYFPQDCGAATQNILLEAVSLGLGTCWCGVYPGEDRVTAIRKILNIPESKFPFNVIAVGTPGESPDARGFFEESKVRFVE